MKSSRSSAESTSKTESGVAYAQGDENRLCGLLEDLRRVRAVGARPGLQQPSLQVLEKANELNRVRYCPGNARFLEGRRALRSSSIRKGCGNDYLESMRYFRIEGLLDGSWETRPVLNDGLRMVCATILAMTSFGTVTRLLFIVHCKMCTMHVHASGASRGRLACIHSGILNWGPTPHRRA